MLVKTSSIEPVPNWVDKKIWEQYKAIPHYPRNLLYKTAKYLERKIAEPIVTAVFTKIEKPLSWDDVENLIVKVGGKIKGEYEPDLLFGIEKGGALYLRRLAEEIGIDPHDPEKVAKMNISHYRDKLGNNMLTQWVPMIFYRTRIESVPEINTDNKKILLVDDDIGTGKTLKAGKNHYERTARDLKSAVMCGNQTPAAIKMRKFLFRNKEPDFFAVPEAFGLYPWYQL